MLPTEMPLAKGADAFVPVQTEWDDWRLAQARVSDLHDLHWYQPAGAPRPLLHAFVDRDELVPGDVLSGLDGERLLVCVLKSHTPAPLYDALAGRAGEQDPPGAA